MVTVLKDVAHHDAGSLRPARRMPDGRVRADAYITRVGVFDYYDANGQRRRELRHPDDVFDRASLDSFAQVPVTNDHPPVGLVTSKNARKYAVGATDAVVNPEGQHVKTGIVVFDADAVAAMDSGKVQLSGGYSCDLEMQGGVDPVYGPYDARQRNIRGNHVAIVDAGRAGSSVRARMDEAGEPCHDVWVMQARTDDLSAAQRHNMPAMDFAVPHEEGLPIPDADHVRAAMARFNQYQFSSGADKSAAFHKIVNKAKQLGVDPSGFVQEWRGRLDVVESGQMNDAETLRALNAQLKDAEAARDAALEKSKTETTRADTAIGELEIARKKISELQAAVSSAAAAVETAELKREKERADAAEAKVARFDETFQAAVRARAKLEHQAHLVKGPAFRTDDLTDRAIRVEVIKHLDSTADVADNVADGVIVGMFNALTGAHAKTARQLARAGEAIAENAGIRADAEETSREDELEEKRRMMRERGKQPLPSDIRSRIKK